ncbi:unnamed protein product [Adineta ricciae]|uniref:Uncharacterized protein n=1 Tax=Adineta ricciae TaxID=249248 RepID=A0A813R100_ADIRI|nr:unnamed protein product [Adineta ricciae]
MSNESGDKRLSQIDKSFQVFHNRQSGSFVAFSRREITTIIYRSLSMSVPLLGMTRDGYFNIARGEEKSEEEIFPTKNHPVRFVFISPSIVFARLSLEYFLSNLS